MWKLAASTLLMLDGVGHAATQFEQLPLQPGGRIGDGRTIIGIASGARKRNNLAPAQALRGELPFGASQHFAAAEFPKLRACVASRALLRVTHAGGADTDRTYFFHLVVLVV